MKNIWLFLGLLVWYLHHNHVLSLPVAFALALICGLNWSRKDKKKKKDGDSEK